MSKKVAVIGGGIAGSSVALYLAQSGLDVTLFEKESTLVSGPPACHLHAGGNLYREIDDNQCRMLLKQSIELLRLYPFAIDFRPTVIATPTHDPHTPQDLLPRLEMLQAEYEELIKQDPNNEVLGKSEDYFKLYTKQMMEQLREKECVPTPKTLDEWMIPVAKNVNFDLLKFPLIMVQEYGLNIFRISANVSLLLEKMKNVTTHLETVVEEIEVNNKLYNILYSSKSGQKDSKSFDYLINAAGFKSGEIDDMLGFKRDRLVEFKAAYVTKCNKYEGLWPEVIFHGKRGTPQGMAQFTPYPDGYFQLHGMTKDITLFDNGLVRSSKLSAQPKLDVKFLQKIDQGWDFSLTQSRTRSAIDHLAQFIPAFKDAKVASKPLYGAQQIPGEDADLRASEVSFEGDTYARCEIVKASSIISMAQEIEERLMQLGFINQKCQKEKLFSLSSQLTKEQVDARAIVTCNKRGYPKSLAYVNNSI